MLQHSARNPIPTIISRFPSPTPLTTAFRRSLAVLAVKTARANPLHMWCLNRISTSTLQEKQVASLASSRIADDWCEHPHGVSTPAALLDHKSLQNEDWHYFCHGVCTEDNIELLGITVEKIQHTGSDISY